MTAWVRACERMHEAACVWCWRFECKSVFKRWHLLHMLRCDRMTELHKKTNKDRDILLHYSGCLCNKKRAGIHSSSFVKSKFFPPSTSLFLRLRLKLFCMQAANQRALWQNDRVLIVSMLHDPVVTLSFCFPYTSDFEKKKCREHQFHSNSLWKNIMCPFNAYLKIIYICWYLGRSGFAEDVPEAQSLVSCSRDYGLSIWRHGLQEISTEYFHLTQQLKLIASN